jgi:phosphohistidine phosphatase
MRLAEVVSQIDTDRKTALLVGHNPGMEELVLLLTAESVQIPTGTCAKIAVKAGKWANAVDKRATLEWLVKPRELE